MKRTNRFAQMRAEPRTKTHLCQRRTRLAATAFIAIPALCLAAPPYRADSPTTTAGADAAPATSSGTAPETPLSEDCFDELENGQGAEIACLVPLRLSDTERTELETGSRGYVKDVACTLTVRISRATIAEAISAADHVFESPEQPVTCTVTTHKSRFDVTATFAPRIVFKNDAAVEATPGLANVKGVNRAISWPVVMFVNRWPSIRTGLMRVADAYRRHARGRHENGPSKP